MLDFLNNLPWQHKILVGSVLSDMILATLVVYYKHNEGRKEHAFWALWDFTALCLFIWGGVHLSVAHLLFGATIVWPLTKHIRYFTGNLPLKPLPDTLKVGAGFTLFSVCIVSFQIAMLVNG